MIIIAWITIFNVIKLPLISFMLTPPLLVRIPAVTSLCMCVRIKPD